MRSPVAHPAYNNFQSIINPACTGGDLKVTPLPVEGDGEVTLRRTRRHGRIYREEAA